MKVELDSYLMDKYLSMNSSITSWFVYWSNEQLSCIEIELFICVFFFFLDVYFYICSCHAE